MPPSKAKAAAIREHLLSKYLQLFIVTRSSIDDAPFSYVLPHDSTLRDALTTHVELLCLRLGVQACFVVFVDGNAPYFLAGIKVSKSGQVSVSEGLPETAELLGSGSDDKRNWLRIFADVIATGAASPEDPVLHISLSDDERSKNISSVRDGPHLSFFAGTPMPIKQGVSIGAVFVVDSARRQRISEKEKKTFVTAAEKCMEQLEFARESTHYLRWKRMNLQMREFVGSRDLREQQLEEPPQLGKPDQETRRKTELKELERVAVENGQEPPNTEDIEHPDGARRDHPEFQRGERTEILRNESTAKDDATHTEQPSASKSHQTMASIRPKSGDTTYRKVFRRAAECIQEALQVDGVLFTDGLVGYHGGVQPMAEMEEELQREVTPKVEEAEGDNEETTQQRSSVPTESQSQDKAPSCPHNRGSTRTSPTTKTYSSPEYVRGLHIQRPAEVLGMSTRNPDSLPESLSISDTTMGLAGIDEGRLQVLMDLSPEGSVWMIHGESRNIYRIENDQLVEDKRSDTKRLILSFPGVRQVVFQPLTDPVSLKRLAGCFAWTTQREPVFTDSTDLPSLRGFLHLLESEISRIDAAAAVKQKEAFVSSVSHELRTPLHGILGSVQLLADTPLNAFQSGLAETIKTSGSTLNETLTSVLAYAKINQFERQQHKRRQRQAPDEEWSLKMLEGRPPGPDTDYQDLYLETSIATLFEETVGVLEAGRSYDKGIKKGAVTVLLDIDFQQNWNYYTEPGALRRIAINIIGNALKYTSQGLVKITLSASRLDSGDTSLSKHNEGRRMVTFTVEDTGKGMSEEFMIKHLFVPFTQEDTTTSHGVGLGMSIVKGLVSLLAGEIKVKSEQGKGTTIIVAMPMRLVEPEHTKSELATSDLERMTASLRTEHLSTVVFGFSAAIRQGLEKYLQDWFQCELLECTDTVEPDVILVDEGNPSVASDIARTAEQYGRSGVLLSIAMVADTLSRPMEPIKGYKSWERIPRPIGPNNLGKALASCVIKLTELRQRRSAGANDDDDSHEIPSEAHKHLKHMVRKEQSEMNGHAQLSSSFLPQSISDRREQENRPPKAKHPQTQETIPIRPGSSEGSNEHTNQSALKVLVVEDNAINRKILGAFLKKYGCEDVTYAENGSIAVRNVEERAQDRFDIIFMDLSMPVMDGFAATRKIRQFESDQAKFSAAAAYIVALTGLASDSDEYKALKSGVDEYITKPVQYEKLKAVLEHREGIGGEDRGQR